MSFCNILAVGVCITQMAHQGAILAQRPAERELGYLHVNHRSPKTATLGCSWRWSSGTHSSSSFFFFLFFFFCHSLSYLYNWWPSGIPSPQSGCSARQLQASLRFSRPVPPSSLPHPPLSVLPPQSWALDPEGHGPDWTGWGVHRDLLSLFASFFIFRLKSLPNFHPPLRCLGVI